MTQMTLTPNDTPKNYFYKYYNIYKSAFRRNDNVVLLYRERR